MAHIHDNMLGIIIIGLFFVVKGSAAPSNSSHGSFSRTLIPLSLLSLPRAIVPLPTLITNLPSKLLVDTEVAPSQDHTEETGREGAFIGFYQSPFTTFADQSLASQCESSWSSEYSKYVATGAITTFYSGGPKWYWPDWTYTIQTPCCGVCQIDGIEVDLSYWPTPAPTPVVTALVNDVGFTLYAMDFSLYIVSTTVFSLLLNSNSASHRRCMLYFAPFRHMTCVDV